jgi:hypothetical protein
LPIVGGTANGVLYLNGSKVVTSGSALTFDGTRLGIGTATPARSLEVVGSIRLSTANRVEWGTNNDYIVGDSGVAMLFGINNAEQMRLTSTGLGIGTSSPTQKLDVNGTLRLTDPGASRDLLIAASTTGSTHRFYSTNTAAGYSFENNAGTFMTLDASGNLGLGVTPSAWKSDQKVIQVGASSSIQSNTSAANVYVNSNAYYAATDTWTYITGGYASSYEQYLGAHKWYTAPSGTAGNAISFTQALTLDANRNLLLNGTAAPASGVGTLAIFNGTAPTGSVTNGIVLYAEDVSSSSELKVRDEAGNVTTLSPHNFELIPKGPSEDMAWSYYSERDGKRINVDMLKAIRLLEKLSGEQLVYEA